MNPTTLLDLIVWLLPIAYLLHFLEELPRFPRWATRRFGWPYTRTQFVAENAVLFSILLASVVWFQLAPGPVPTVLVLAAAIGFLANVPFHAVPTLRTGEYSPGTVTACLLFAPLATVILVLAWLSGMLSLWVVLPSMLLGLLMLPLVVLLVRRGLEGRLPWKRVALLALGVPPLIVMQLGGEQATRILAVLGPLAVVPLLVKLGRDRLIKSGGSK